MVKHTLLFLALSTACAAPLTETVSAPIAGVAAKARFTVVEFFSSDCGCQRAHDERLKELAAEFLPLGVQFVAVDSEAGATEGKDDAERRARGYPFALLTDNQGAWADALGATYATYVVVLDERGGVLYRGGIDSDKQHLTADASLWLRETLSRLVRGEAPRVSRTNALGCVLRRR
jgi:Redoxin